MLMQERQPELVSYAVLGNIFSDDGYIYIGNKDSIQWALPTPFGDGVYPVGVNSKRGKVFIDLDPHSVLSEERARLWNTKCFNHWMMINS